jgi:hypothetical protein
MDQPIADRVGDAGLANRGMPGRGRELTGDQGRVRSLRSSMTSNKSRRPASVNGAKASHRSPRDQFGPFRQKPDERPVAAADGELVEQARRADVGGGEAVPTRALDKGADCRSARSARDWIVRLANPRARPETEDHAPREAARRGEIHVLE